MHHKLSVCITAENRSSVSYSSKSVGSLQGIIPKVYNYQLMPMDPCDTAWRQIHHHAVHRTGRHDDNRLSTVDRTCHVNRHRRCCLSATDRLLWLFNIALGRAVAKFSKSGFLHKIPGGSIEKCIFFWKYPNFAKKQLETCSSFKFQCNTGVWRHAHYRSIANICVSIALHGYSSNTVQSSEKLYDPARIFSSTKLQN